MRVTPSAFLAVTEWLPAPMLLLSTDGTILARNRAAARLLGGGASGAGTSGADTANADTASADTGSADTGSADTGSADTGSAGASSLLDMVATGQAEVAGYLRRGARTAQPLPGAIVLRDETGASVRHRASLRCASPAGKDTPALLHLILEPTHGPPTRFKLLTDRIAELGVEIQRRKLAEEARQRLESQMIQTQKLESLGVLAGGIAHDFNNLLTSVIGYCDLARHELPPGAASARFLDEAAHGARRAAELTQQMLAYSGKGQFIVEPVVLSDLLQDMARLLEVSISKKCVLRYDLMANQPPCKADATQLRQVIMNLIINASDAIGDRSGVISLTTGAAWCDAAYLAENHIPDLLAEGLYVYLEVADTGMRDGRRDTGQDLRPVLHDEVHRARTRARRGARHRTGPRRGDPRVQRARARHDVQAAVPGNGHRRRGRDDRGGAGRRLARGRPGARGGRRGEHSRRRAPHPDADGLRGAVRGGWPRGDRAVPRACRPQPAGAARPHHAAPRRRGNLRGLRQLRPDVRIILMSGYNAQSVMGQFAGKGLAGFIQKPFRIAELREAVQRALAGHELNVS